MIPPGVESECQHSPYLHQVLHTANAAQRGGRAVVRRNDQARHGVTLSLAGELSTSQVCDVRAPLASGPTLSAPLDCWL